jgi:hypothetical protein
MLESELTCSALSANPRNFDPALIKARRLVAKDRRGAVASAAYEMGTDSRARRLLSRGRPAMPARVAHSTQMPVGKGGAQLRLLASI